MRGRWARGVIVVAVVVFLIVLAGAPAALRAAHLNWPAWLVAAVAAVGVAAAGWIKPVIDAIGSAVGSRAARHVERTGRYRDLLDDVTGPGNPLPKVTDPIPRGLLGIHPAIPLPVGADSELSVELPSYVARDLDATLRTWLSAHTRTGGFALIVGRAAAGKTRCAYEAIKASVPDWRLLMPGSGTQLVDVLKAGGELARTVIWLDDAERFVGQEGLTAVAVRRLLADPARPVLIVGTIWPDRLEALTTGGSKEIGEDAREILGRLATRFDLAARFSPEELDRAGLVAKSDPRLAEATATGADTVAETLAAVPELVRRWRHGGNSYGCAVITAAVIARRCGHPNPVPAAVLEQLAAYYLSTQERARADDQWFASGLAWAREPVRGAAAPLTPHAELPGVVDGDEVFDVLVQHTDVPDDPISDHAWRLVIEHSRPEACLAIADIAYFGTHLVAAELACRKASDAGHITTMTKLGFLLEERAEINEAERWYRAAAQAGHATAMFNLAVLLNRQGNIDEAEHWYRTAAQTGYANAMYNLGDLLSRRGHFDDAEHWWRQAAEAGHIDAMYNMGIRLHEQSKTSEAVQWWQKAAEAGDADAISVLEGLRDADG